MGKVIKLTKKERKPNFDGLTLLYKTPFEYEAYLITGLLKSRGIPCYLENRKHLPHPVSASQLGEYLIWVPVEWFKVAQKCLK